MAYLSSAWNLVGGFAGQHSLGHVLFIGVGAYTSTLLFSLLGINPWFGAIAGAVLAALLAAAMGYLSFRYGIRGAYFFLVTLAFAEVAKIIVANVQFMGASSGLSVPMRGHMPSLFQFESKEPYLLIIAVMLTITLIICHITRYSRFGIHLLALRENEDAARACGVPAQKTKISVLILSAVLCALGGTFYAQYTLFIEPQSMFGIALSLEIVLFAIVGGIGTIYGPAAGAVILFAIAEGTRNMVGLGNTGNLHLIVYAVVLIVVVMFLPEGFAGAWDRLHIRLRGSVFKGVPLLKQSELNQQSIERVQIATKLRTSLNVSAELNPLLDVQGITRRFGGVIALSNVSFQVAPGECLGLIGPNGSGKSTLLNVVAGVHRPDQGHVRLAGRTLAGLDPESVCRLGVGRTHQISQPFGDLTTRENVMVGVFARTMRWSEAYETAEPLMRRMGIAHLADTKVRFLTTANRKKVELARALATRPKLLLLDESLAGLTEQESSEMINLLLELREEGVTMILVEHIMRVVTELCDRVVFLNFGQIVTTGRPKEVLSNGEVIKIYLGDELRADTTFS